MSKLPDIVLWADWDRGVCQGGVKGEHLSSSFHPAFIKDVDSQDAEGR